jgi:ParB family transcriptional regulator, chromosome partitioning protein
MTTRYATFPDGDPPRSVSALAERIQADGGHALAVYREPVGDHWHIFALLPTDAVAPTPYQRDLSPTHAKRLQEMVKKVDRFVDPIVVVAPQSGVYWTPNGHHRLAVLGKLRAKWAPAIVIPDSDVAYLILALNTEKAHNLKERSLEVVRMYRGLRDDEPRRGEADYAFQFEAPHLLTLGLIYEENKRFAGGAFAPILKRVDKFLPGSFAKTRETRDERALAVKAVDVALSGVVAQLRKRGIRHPFVKNFVLARTTPLTRQRKAMPSFDQTFARLLANIESFDAARVRYDEVQRSALFAAPAGD